MRTPLPTYFLLLHLVPAQAPCSYIHIRHFSNSPPQHMICVTQFFKVLPELWRDRALQPSPPSDSRSHSSQNGRLNCHCVFPRNCAPLVGFDGSFFSCSLPVPAFRLGTLSFLYDSPHSCHARIWLLSFDSLSLFFSIAEFNRCPS